jgi:polysaccharide pyruvyl transferase WcaK-like protein
MKKILIFGYYNRQNWGDDVFEYVFKNYIFNDSNKYQLIFKNLDSLYTSTESYTDIDVVIIGGGDVINSYFFDTEKLAAFRRFFEKKPIYFVGIGLTYPNLINVMDIGDYFFMRNKTDLKYTRDRYSEFYTQAIPDLAFNLMNESNLINFNKPQRAKKDIKKIGIALPSPWLSDDEQIRTKFLDNICTLAKDLSVDHEIHFIPFDTSNNGTSNSDVKMIQEIQRKLHGQSNNIYYILPNLENGLFKSISTNEMIEYFKNLDLVICGRFHATILSILTHTPFICVYASKKLDNLKSDMNNVYNHFIKLDVDGNNVPIEFPKKRIIDMFRYVKNNYISSINSLKNFSINMKTETLEFNSKIKNLVDSDDSLVIFRQSPPQYITSESKKVLIKSTISNILQRVSNNVSMSDVDAILRGQSLRSILPKSRYINLESFKKILTEEILWSLTGDPYAPYYYGLYDNIFGNNFLDQLKWIIDDYYENYSYKSATKKNNVTLVNKNFQRLHRSGWQYIVNNIVMQLNNNDNINEPLIIDTYIDKTFHWNKEFYSNKGIIPYKRKWIGFVHHTYSDYNNSYNCVELFKDETFIESLKECSALIVMTGYLSNQIKQSLNKLNIKHVKVHTILHPTENTDVIFTWDNFMNNSSKQIVQVGNWLRDVFAIYKVNLPSSSIITEKSILRNKNTENYFPPNNFLNDLYQELNDEDNVNNQHTVIDICRNAFKNMHIKGLYNYIVEMEESVKVIDFLDNSEYDNLLSKNIVFLHLVDASACNTLIECVVRNTPIIVNPIPPVVEILGKDYPLYYNNYYEVSKILDNPSLIKQGYDYLKNMPKEQLDINAFITELTNIVTAYAN